MFQGGITERRNKYYSKEQYNSDERRNNSSLNAQNMIFPYIGPPGSGPGLLGNRPGAGKTEYLIALEHYAAGLKRALTIITELKNKKNKDVDVELECDSVCSIESELKNKSDDSASSL
ncbi:hypothetical protein X975_14541, partial [Stegodyphus mimosarum]